MSEPCNRRIRAGFVVFRAGFVVFRAGSIVGRAGFIVFCVDQFLDDGISVCLCSGRNLRSFERVFFIVALLIFTKR